MNFILSRFRIFVLALMFVLPGLGLAQGSPEPATDPTPNPQTQPTNQNQAQPVNNGCNERAFSLHSALKSAQNQTDDSRVILPTGLPGATKSQNIGAESAIEGFAGLLQRIINGLTAIAAAVAVFFIVFNGGGMVLAAGDMEKIKKARMGIVWALLGLLLIMASYIIAKTAISITYSGADRQIEGQNEFGVGCDEEPVVNACEGKILEEGTYSDEGFLKEGSRTFPNGRKESGTFTDDGDFDEGTYTYEDGTQIEYNNGECANAAACAKEDEYFDKTADEDEVSGEDTDGENEIVVTASKGVCQNGKPLETARASTEAAAPAEEPAQCKPQPSIPASCYGGELKSGTKQTGVGGPGRNCDNRINSGNALQGVCADLGISGSCNIANVQDKIDYSRLGSEFPQDCRQKDARYGQCTVKAIQLHYANIEVCPKVEASE